MLCDPLELEPSIIGARELAEHASQLLLRRNVASTRVALSCVDNAAVLLLGAATGDESKREFSGAAFWLASRGVSEELLAKVAWFHALCSSLYNKPKPTQLQMQDVEAYLELIDQFVYEISGEKLVGSSQTTALEAFHRMWCRLPAEEKSLVAQLGQATRLQDVDNTEERVAEAESCLTLWSQTQSMLPVAREVSASAARQFNIVVSGPRGSEKLAVSYAIHYTGRPTAPCQRETCARPEHFERRLFGDDAVETALVGLLESCRGGTLILEEIETAPLASQRLLATALAAGLFRPLNSSRTVKLDVRIIAITAKNLSEMTQSGDFSPELYAQICVIEIAVPPLRERSEDFPLFFAAVFSENAVSGTPIPTLAPDALEAFRAYHWPGNQAELQNEVKRLLFAEAESDGLIKLPELSSHIRRSKETSSKQTLPSCTGTTTTLSEALALVEQQVIASTLESTSGNKSQAAKQLGISRSNLIAKVAKYGI